MIFECEEPENHNWGIRWIGDKTPDILFVMDKDTVTLKDNMDRDTTYLLCPDPTCKLFWDTSRFIPCEDECPLQDKLIKMIRCRCGEVIELPGDHFMLRRVDHKHKDGNNANNFQRMSGKYGIMYERPE